MAGRVVFGITSNSMIDSNKLPNKAKAGYGQSIRKFHSIRRRRGSQRRHPYSDHLCLTLWRTAWVISLGCNSTAILMRMARQCTTANRSINSNPHNLVSSTLRLTVNLGSSLMRSLGLLSNTPQLDLSPLPTNSIPTLHNSRSNSHPIKRTVRRRLLYLQGQHPRPSARAQEHRIRNPVSIILLTRLWRTGATIFVLTRTYSPLLCTRSRKMCSRSVLNGYLSSSVMAHLNSTLQMNKRGGYLRILSESCGNTKTLRQHLRQRRAHNRLVATHQLVHRLVHQLLLPLPPSTVKSQRRLLLSMQTRRG